MSTMSITRALVTLKTLNSQIESAIQSGKFVSRTIGKNQFRKVFGSTDSVEAMSAKIQSSFDTVDGLIARRTRIKSAIVLSNATTKVTVLGQEMTVAECIDLKSTAEFRKIYLSVLRTQLAREMVDVEKANAVLQAAIDTSMNAIYGSEKTKVTEDAYKQVSNPQKEQKEAELLDPQKIETKIQKLADEILQLESELNFLLSEHNARTTIDVD